MTSQRQHVIDAIARELVRLGLRRPARVAVDGITAAGKTTFASELADAVRALGRPCVHVTMDGFHQPRAIRHRQGRESADGYYEDAYDFAALRRELLEPLGESGSRRYRTAVIDLATDMPADAASELAPDDLVLIVDGSFLQRPEIGGAWDRVIYLAASFDIARARGVARDAAQLGSPENAERLFRTRYHAAQRRYLDEVGPDTIADAVIDHDDPAHPVIRSLRRVPRDDPRAAETRAFFGPRAEAWNERFKEDAAGFVIAVDELAITPGETVLDLGCGAGRALADLAAAVGTSGTVIGLDVTAEMLAAARRESSEAALVLALAEWLPLGDSTCDVILAAGLLSHLDDPLLGLVEIGRVARPGARLGIFHPVGRAALAHKHGHELRPDDPLDPANLEPMLAAAGWVPRHIDDSPNRYFALAIRPVTGS